MKKQFKIFLFAFLICAIFASTTFAYVVKADRSKNFNIIGSWWNSFNITYEFKSNGTMIETFESYAGAKQERIYEYGVDGNIIMIFPKSTGFKPREFLIVSKTDSLMTIAENWVGDATTYSTLKKIK